MDWVVTGASRGIGAALVRAIAARATAGDRLFVLARHVEHMAGMRPSPEVLAVKLDLSDLEGARRVGVELAARLSNGAVLVHNAGLWPSRRVVVDGLEAAFTVNCLGPLAFQRPMLDAGCLARVLVVGAGLLALGRFDPDRTPAGRDFSWFRTYCTTKLAGACAMRDVAKAHPSVDFAVVHPGVANTELGARPGAIGWLVARIKQRWLPAETCALRLMELLAEPRWQSAAGEAPWFFEAERRPWPEAVDRDAASIRAAVHRLLGAEHAPRARP